MRSSWLFALTGVLALTLLAPGISACGDDDNSSSDEADETGTLTRLAKAQRENKQPLITGQEVEAAGDDPAATLLRWWQFIQYSAPEQALASYTDAARPRARRLRRQTAPLRYYFLERRPFILDQRITGSKASVFTSLAKSSKVTSDPTVFSLEKSEGKWRLTDNTFLEKRYAAEVAYKEEQQGALEE